MGVQNELFGSAFVEVDIALRRIFERNDCGVDRFSNVYVVVKDCHHELAMVAHDWPLSGREGWALGRTPTAPQTKLSELRIFIEVACITGHVPTTNAHPP